MADIGHISNGEQMSSVTTKLNSVIDGVNGLVNGTTEAAVATNAINDEDGNSIKSTYAKISGGSVQRAEEAVKLSTARTLTVDLKSSATPSFNGTANATMGVSGFLPVEKGGTGVTSENALQSKIDGFGYSKTIIREGVAIASEVTFTFTNGVLNIDVS